MTLRFLVDADLPRDCVDVIRERGWEAAHVADVGLATAKDEQIADYARGNGLTLVTGDFGFGDIRNYPPHEYPGIIVLGFPNTWEAREIVSLVGAFFADVAIVADIKGKLAIVEQGRVRFRQ
jgi:predicted nuclease of predicted toxin-antitoxin system